MKQFASNTLWMLGQRIYGMLLSLAVGALSARYLGPGNYGLLNYAAAILSFFTVVSGLGLDGVLVAEMIRSPAEEGSFLGTALVLRLGTSLLSLLGIALLVRLLEPENLLLQTVTILQSLSVVLHSTEVLHCWFQAKLRMKYVSLAAMVGLTATALWRITLLIRGASVTYFALSASISALVSGFVVLGCFLWQKHPQLTFRVQTGKALLGKSYHFILSGLAVNLYSQMDRIMLARWTNQQEVGFYSAAMTIAILWEFLPQSLIHSSRPLILERKQNEEETYLQSMQMLLLVISLLGLGIGTGFLILGKLAVQILYGAAYAPAFPMLCILIWSTCFAMIGQARGIWIMAEEKHRYVKYYICIGALGNFFLNVWLIPIWGGMGAAAATLVSQIVVAVIAPLLFSKTREFVRLYFQAFLLIKPLLRAIRRRKGSV